MPENLTREIQTNFMISGDTVASIVTELSRERVNGFMVYVKETSLFPG